jgi:hypothetical protein
MVIDKQKDKLITLLTQKYLLNYLAYWLSIVINIYKRKKINDRWRIRKEDRYRELVSWHERNSQASKTKGQRPK